MPNPFATYADLRASTRIPGFPQWVYNTIQCRLVFSPEEAISPMTIGLAVSAGTMTRLKTIAAEEGATPQDLAEKAIRRFLRFKTR